LDLDNKHTQLAKENERNEQLKTRFSQMKMNAGSMVAKALQVSVIYKFIAFMKIRFKPFLVATNYQRAGKT
jgi:hypothetical protein